MRHLLATFCTLGLMAGGAVHAEEVYFENGKALDGTLLMVGDQKQWDARVWDQPMESASGYLSVAPDAEDGALDATWNGKGEAQLFLALTEKRDMGPLFEQDGALVVLLKVDKAPNKAVDLRMSCGYPCGADADISKLLKALPEGQWLRVSFDLKCYADGGLNSATVDSPFLISTKGKLALSVSDVRIVPGAGESATIRCR